MAAKKPATTSEQKPPAPRARVVGWLKDLAAAGPDMDKARALLNRVRTDPNANRTDREHFYRTLAQQSVVWYLGAIRGKPLSGDEVKLAAKEALAASKRPARTAKPAPK